MNNQRIPNPFADLTFDSPDNETSFLRLALVGPTGSGKTWTSLSIATAMCDRVAVIDTENGTAAKYRKYFNFQQLKLMNHSPAAYIHCINLAVQQGYDALIIDSLSHAWAGRGGALEMVDDASARAKGNSWAAWREVTPEHNALVDALIYADIHMLATMRAKTEWHVTKDNNGKTVPIKIGLAPVQRVGLEYEFDIVADMDTEHNFVVTKTRCFELDNKVIKKPDGKELAETLIDWLSATRPQYDVVEPDTEDEPVIDTVAALPEESSAPSNNQATPSLVPAETGMDTEQEPIPADTDTDNDEESPAEETAAHTQVVIKLNATDEEEAPEEVETDDDVTTGYAGDVIFTEPPAAAAPAEPKMTKTATIKLINAKGATVYEDWPKARKELVSIATDERTTSITRVGDNEIGFLVDAVNNREAQIKELNEIGETLYPDRWFQVCTVNTMKLTNNRTEKIPALTDEELSQFMQAIRNMQKTAQQQAAA